MSNGRDKLRRAVEPRGLLVRAALLLGALGVVHALGWREHTSFLSGTAGDAEGSREMQAVQGLLYILAWLGAWVAAPILALAAALLPLFHCREPNRR